MHNGDPILSENSVDGTLDGADEMAGEPPNAEFQAVLDETDSFDPSEHNG